MLPVTRLEGVWTAETHKLPWGLLKHFLTMALWLMALPKRTVFSVLKKKKSSINESRGHQSYCLQGSSEVLSSFLLLFVSVGVLMASHPSLPIPRCSGPTPWLQQGWAVCAAHRMKVNWAHEDDDFLFSFVFSQTRAYLIVTLASSVVFWGQN